MPTRKLTDLFVERVNPPARGRIEYFDASFGGLALRVTQAGGKSWSVFYRFHGRLRRLTIGHYPAIKPAQARREAQAALERIRQGADPADEKRARRDRRSPEADIFGAVARDYLDRHHKRNSRESTFLEAERDLEHNAIPRWDKRPIASITRGEVRDLIDRIVARGAEVQANRTLTRLRALFNWAVEKDRFATSPAAGLKLPTKENARDRVLSDNELRWLWQGCDEIGWPFGSLAKLLLLTAQRRDEVAGMERAELDLAERVWTIPSARAKNGACTRCICRTPRSSCCNRCHASGSAWCSPPTAKVPFRDSRAPSAGSTLRWSRRAAGRWSCRLRMTIIGRRWASRTASRRRSRFRTGRCTTFAALRRLAWRG